MKKLEYLKRISCLLGLLLCVAFFTLACGANNTSTKNEKPAVATKGEATKELKEVKVSKPNAGGLKQELSTKAAVSTTDKKQITFEVPASQLQGLKVGDALAINNGKDAYPAKILTIPPTQPANINQGSKVIITAQVGPGINLPGNKRDYTVTYLYNNRDPRSYYIKKNYVYYDGPRSYVYVTGPDRVIRRKYIRTGLINRYYVEILDEINEAERIVEDYINDYVDNVVIPSIIEDNTNQMINQYQEYVDTLNQRWDFDDDVNTFTVDVDDIDWEKLEEQDTVLTDQDITEIYEEIQTETYSDEGGYQGGGDIDGSGYQGGGDIEEGSQSNSNYNDDSANDKNDDETDNVVVSADKDDDKDETTEAITYESESNEAVTGGGDYDVNDDITTTYNNYDNADDNNVQNDEPQYNNSNDDSDNHDNSNDNDANDNYSGGDDSGNEEYETTTYEVANDDD